jgi:hypothetical protein
MIKLLADENFDNTIVRGLGSGRAIQNILLILECSLEGELEGCVQYLPLQSYQQNEIFLIQNS